MGYDLDARRKRLVVNAKEARQVRALFQLVAQHGFLQPALAEAERKGWTTKTWVTTQNKRHAGGTFGEGSLLRLLRNPLYQGLVRHNGKLYPGEHAAIVDPAVWNQANERIQNEVPALRKKSGKQSLALVQGLLHCGQCGGEMAHITTAPTGRRYRYYVCTKAGKKGSQACRQQRVPASAIEQSVVQQIDMLASNPEREKVRVLGDFAPNWKSGSTDQRRLLGDLIERITYDGATGRVSIRLRQAEEKHV